MFKFLSEKQISLPEHNCVLPHALRVPSLQKLVGKRVVLASNSPRRKEILQIFVGCFTEIRAMEAHASVEAGPCPGDRPFDIQ